MSWNSYSKSDTARRPRTMTLAPWRLAYSASSPEKPVTSTLERCASAVSAKSTRSSRVKHGVLPVLPATATITFAK